MQIDRIEVGDRMSKIVKHNGTIYLCGQVAKNITAGITEQTQTMLEKVETLLAEAGSSREHILSATIYLCNMEDFNAMNDVWDAWILKGHPPVRACVEARLAKPEMLVEISIVAAAK